MAEVCGCLLTLLSSVSKGLGGVEWAVGCVALNCLPDGVQSVVPKLVMLCCLRAECELADGSSLALLPEGPISSKRSPVEPAVCGGW